MPRHQGDRPENARVLQPRPSAAARRSSLSTARRFGAEERRARLAIRHHVAAPTRVDGPLDAVRGVVALHATDPATVYLSAWARLITPSIRAVDDALYDDRSLVRMLAMRRTMFVAPVDDAPILHAATSLAIARNERRRNEQLVAMLDVAEPAAWLRKVERATLEALRLRGEATAQDLSKDVPELQRKVHVNVGKKYEGDIGISSRVLLQLALDAQIVRGRPRGTWISSQYRWAPMERWLGGAMPELAVAEAQAELVRKWLARFGPATEADLRWWTGLTAREIRAALATIGATDVDLDGALGIALPDDLDPTPPVPPWVALLPALDATTMGWQGREWYLGPHKAHLFDGNGNAGPTVWADGRIVGGWSVRGGEVVTRLLEDVGAEHVAAIEREAARLTALLDSVSVVPRFPTPLHKELVARPR